MLHDKFQDHKHFILQKNIYKLKVFTIYERGGHHGHVT